jgi:hypothetical protein
VQQSIPEAGGWFLRGYQEVRGIEGVWRPALALLLLPLT